MRQLLSYLFSARFKKKLIPYGLILLFFNTISCITPIDVVIDEEVNVLVIDGYITTDYGPHEMRITRSAKFGDVFVGTIKLIAQARVSVRDQTGTVTNLIEDRPGFYFTPEDFKGEIGYSYTLLVETNAGEDYSSFPQTILPTPPIKDVIFQFKNTPLLDPLALNSGIEILVQFDDPVDEINYYMWELDGNYKLFTYPELFYDPGTGTLSPKDCCAICYISETVTDYDLLSDLQLKAGSITQKVGYVLNDGKRLTDTYKIYVRQFSIDEEAFEFYKRLRSQLDVSGGIFDPPPANIGSNIINLNNPNEPTLGYFGAFDVQYYETFIDLDVVDVPLRRLQIIDDCRVLKNSTTERPADWD